MRRFLAPVLLLLAVLALVGAALLRARLAEEHEPEPEPPSAADAPRAAPPTGTDAPPAGQLDWSELDVEGRWLTIRALDPASPEAQELLDRVVAEGDWELLEWLAIYPWFVGDNEAANRMTAAKPPNLMRVAAWSLESPDTHRKGWGYTVLTAREPALARSWVHRYPYAVDSLVTSTLDKMQLDEVSAEGQLPPLDPAEVLRHLDAPARLATLEPGTRADPDMTYVHQVLRAIDGLAASERLREGPYQTRLRKLTEHPHPRVRQAAYLAYARIPETGVRTWLLDRSKDPDETDEIRAAALLGYSYGNDAAVYSHLLHIPMDDPRAAVAVNRLGDLDHGFALEVLPAPEGVELPPDLEAILTDARQRIAERSALQLDRQGFITLLLRLVICEREAHPFAASLHTWTVQTLLRQTASPEAQADLQMAGKILGIGSTETTTILEEVEEQR